MVMLSLLLPTLAGLFAHAVNGQQFAGSVINNTLQTTYGSEITYWNMPDSAGKNTTLINYSSLTTDNKRLDSSAIQRVLIFVHGNNRDPYNYMSYMLSALSQVQGHSEVNRNSVQLVAPYFPNGDDKGIGYPWNASAPSGGYGSYTNALVWSGAGWMNGTNNQYPNKQKTFSSYQILDTMIQYYDNKNLFPNVKQIVVGGHSAGAQTLHRYAAVGNKLNTKSPVTYYIANPDSYLWFNDERPYDTSSCPTYDYWRAGLSSYTNTYGADLVASGRQNVLANYKSRSIRYARGTDDDGQDSSTCGPFMQGNNRNERFFNFITAFPPTCTPGGVCDTVDYVAIGHDAAGMMASSAGQARLFLDNWSGDGSMAYDQGCPRQQAGDDPYPDPQCGITASPQNKGTYDGYEYMGCYTDTEYPSYALPHTAYVGWSNATIETCVAACSTAGYSIAGTEQGNYCFCGNSMFWDTRGPLPEAGCAVNCTGDSTQTCGDSERISIFSLNGATPAVNPTPSSPATVGTFSYEGCYNEITGRALSGSSSFTNTMTIETCVDFCSSKGYSIAGMEYSTQCFCGNQLAFGANKTVDGLCNAPCGGNQTEFCGGDNVLNVYAVNSTFTGPSNNSTTSSTTTSSTSSASSTTTYPAATGALSCPGSNQQTYTTNGDTFVVECYTDHAGYDIGGSTPFVSTLEACIATCATTSGCLDVSWVPGTSAGVYACYLKSAVGTASTANNVWGARYIGASNSTFVYTTTASTSTTTSSIVSSITSSTVSSTVAVIATSSSSSLSSSSSSTSSSVLSTSPTTSTTISSTSSTTSTTSSASSTPTTLQCPSANATSYTVGTSVFEIECYIDRGTGYLTVKYVDSLNDCINWCANTTSCMDVAWSPATNSPCYLKSEIGSPVTNTGIWGAKLVKVNGKPVVVSSSTTTTRSVGTTSSTTSVVKSSKSKSVKGTTAASTSAVMTLSSTMSTSKTKGGNKPTTSSKPSSTSSSTSTSSSSSIKSGRPGKTSSASSAFTSIKTSTTTIPTTSTKSKSKTMKGSTTSTSTSSSSSLSSSSSGKPTKTKQTTTSLSTTKSKATTSVKSNTKKASPTTAAANANTTSTCTTDACFAAFKSHAKSASKVCNQVAASTAGVVREVDVLAKACLDKGDGQSVWREKAESVCGCIGGNSATATATGM